MTSTSVWRISSTLLLCTGLTAPVAVIAVTDGECGSASGFAACEILAHEELAARRGGFEFAGLKFEFGANIRSYFDNRLVLESMINFTSDGATRQQITELPSSVVLSGVTPPASSPAPSTSATATPQVQLQTPAAVTSNEAAAAVAAPPAHPSALAATTPASVQSNAVAAQTPATVDLSGLRDAVGVSVNDYKGYTAALHQVTRERITGLIINTASGRDLRQELEVRVDVANFRQFQQSARQNLINSRLGATALK